MVLAALTAMALHLPCPRLRAVADLDLPGAHGAGSLILLIAGDPGLVDHERGWVRVVTNLG